jgi:hypothetical protein
MVFIPFFVFQCLVHFLLNPQKQGISEVCFCSLFCRLIPLAAWRKKKERKKTKESDSAWIEIRVKKERIRTQVSVANPSVKKDSYAATMAGSSVIAEWCWLSHFPISLAG